MNKNFLSIAALLGALSVALGAFAAHKLREIFPAEALGIFETGVRYQFYHVFAIFIVGILSGHFSGRWINWSGYCFIAGIVLFSGSLYALAALKAKDAAGLGFIGVITPIGGVFFIIGWLLLFFGISRRN
ncbi:MAG TPA: DUF423 domain-containing protein [Puia sp.]|nr:DUF423 domain-containing protein [Puia sp.]